MDDIIQNLRETRLIWKHNGIDYLELDDLGLLFKAADEIKRLREQVRQLETERDQWQTMTMLRSHFDGRVCI